MAQAASVIKVLCDHLGCMEYDDLLQKTAVDDLEHVLKNRDFFTVIQQNKSKTILVSTNTIRRCRTRDCQETCPDLHLCRFDLLGQCNAQRCKYGHSLESEHNSRILWKHNLHDLTKDQLRVLLLQNDSSLLPNVCVSYNKGSGDFGNCPDKEACVRLHVCEKYIRGLCDGSSECNRCHDFYEPHPMKTLQARGVASQLIGSLLPIYRNILTLKDHRNAQDKPGVRSKEIPKSSDRAKVPESLQRNAVHVICLSFIRGHCRYEDKCWRVHFSLPYKWEVEVDEVWIDIPENEVIERDYCDPAKIHSVGSEPVCFDTMMQGLHRVRRLSTVSSVIEPSFIHTTKWIWYWKDEYNKWIEYGSIKEMHRLSSISSEELEKKYLYFLEDNTHNVVTFTAGTQCFELNFRDMKQRNEILSTERVVRRRPLFVSRFDVRTGRTRRHPNSRTHTGVPGFWNKTAIPESGFQKVLLEASHKDYVRVQEQFKKSMEDFNILTIERVQNKELWEDFQTKRERMRKANIQKKYREGERLLFHGTKARNVDAICRQNFDMTESGANEPVFGQGSYFAKDAKYSNDFTDHYSERFMFACRVLVGQYTKGESRYRRPPAKDAEGNLYDSCVNDVREPTIYVVFERSQVYPEFLIKYEKSMSRSPQDSNINQSYCTERVSKCSNFDDVFNVSPNTSAVSTSLRQGAQANNITSDLTGTGETLAATRSPTMQSPLFAVLDSAINPDKDVFLDTQTDDTKSLNEVLAETKLSFHSKLTQGLTSSSRLLKESDPGLHSSDSDNLLIGAKPSLTDSSVRSKIAKNQQETSIQTSETRSERSQQDSQQDAPLSKSVTDTLDSLSCSLDKARIFDASSSACILEMKSKPPVPYKTGCSEAHRQSPSAGIVSFYESCSSENANQKFDIFDDDIFHVSRTTSVIGTSSPRKACSATSGSTSTGQEFLTSTPDKGLTSLSYTGLPEMSAQDLATSVKSPVSSHSHNKLLILGKTTLTDRSIHSQLRPNPELVTTQRSQSSRRPVATNVSNPVLPIPSATARARNLSSDPLSSPSSHSEQESKISVMYKPSSSSADKQSLSDGSLSRSSVSFYERQPSALSSRQNPSKSTSRQEASHHEGILKAESVQKKECGVQ